MLRFFENFDLGGNCLEKKKNWTFFWKIFKILKILKIRDSSFVALLILRHFIQTEAERRRREAGVKQSMEIRVRSCMWVCMYGIWNYLTNQGT